METYLQEEYFARDTGVVAKDLLGKVLVRTMAGGQMRGRIVETEAYFGQDDPASHAARGRTPRNAVMFGLPGRAYVYFNYGIHYLFNIVTETASTAGAVLVRAVEPIAGVDQMKKNRPGVELVGLTSGPAKMTQALGITIAENGRRLDTAELGVVEDPGADFKIISAARIGISSGEDLPYRYFISGNSFISRQ